MTVEDCKDGCHSWWRKIPRRAGVLCSYRVPTFPPSFLSKQRQWVHASESVALTTRSNRGCKWDDKEVNTSPAGEAALPVPPPWVPVPPAERRRTLRTLVEGLKQHNLELPQEIPGLLRTTSVWKTQSFHAERGCCLTGSWDLVHPCDQLCFLMDQSETRVVIRKQAASSAAATDEQIILCIQMLRSLACGQAHLQST